MIELGDVAGSRRDDEPLLNQSFLRRSGSSCQSEAWNRSRSLQRLDSTIQANGFAVCNILEDAMRKTITAIVATASIAAAALAAPKPAEARCLGCWVGAGIAAGIIGGALASRAYGYGYPAYGYGDGYPADSYGYGYPADSYGYGHPAYGYAPYVYTPAYYGYAPRRYYARRYYRY
jgi:hypothetical protein